MSMTDEQFAQLFLAQQQMMDKLDQLPTKDDYLKLLHAVHDIAAKFADHDEDHRLTDAALERHQKSIQKLAKHTGVQLGY